jgi:hypothetical protein
VRSIFAKNRKRTISRPPTERSIQITEEAWPLEVRQRLQVLYLVHNKKPREIAQELLLPESLVQHWIARNHLPAMRRRTREEITEEIAQQAKRRALEVVDACGELAEQGAVQALQRATEMAGDIACKDNASATSSYAAAGKTLVSIARQARGLPTGDTSAFGFNPDPGQQINLSLFVLPRDGPQPIPLAVARQMKQVQPLATEPEDIDMLG